MNSIGELPYREDTYTWLMATWWGLNIFELLNAYFEARRTANLAHYRFFLSINHGKEGYILKFFKPQPFERNTMTSIVKYVSASLGIRGEGVIKSITTHVLRGSMISLLISPGYSDAAVVLCSGHRDSNSLQSCHSLMGSNGVQQQAGQHKAFTYQIIWTSEAHP